MKFDRKRGSIGIAMIVVFIVAVYLTFLPEKCTGFDCFKKYADDCRRASYINDEPEASWKYEVTGNREQGFCQIEVTLLSAKEGTLELRDYEGNSMTCDYDPSITIYPEKSLDMCQGQLKENLQTIVIERLYNYIVNNLGTINEGLKQI